MQLNLCINFQSTCQHHCCSISVFLFREYCVFHVFLVVVIGCTWYYILLSQVIDIVKQGIGMDDEDQRVASDRFLYICGDPGAGKTAVLLHLALEACHQINVLIVCPTGYLVHKYKALLPEMDGIENIRVDTIQGVLKYKRKGADGKVRWAPPSALRKIDLILCDEASQYEDQEWSRLFSCIKEQPHMPFMAVAADFKQLTPVISGGMCERFTKCMRTVRLKTVYRSTDSEHLVFLNRIRSKQPDREVLSEYFAERQWTCDLIEAVHRGLTIAASSRKAFMWLTSTNKGASEVCEAALTLLGITAQDLLQGYLCDPNSKSPLRILAKPGIIIRLTRNFDKQRGFVNGAMAEIVESLRGNQVPYASRCGSDYKQAPKQFVKQMNHGCMFCQCNYNLCCDYLCVFDIPD